MEKKLGGENPGLVWCNSAITKPVDLSPQVFCDWYRDVHVPDVLETGAITNASRYESMDPNEERPYLTLYYATNTQDLEEKLQGWSDVAHFGHLESAENLAKRSLFTTRFSQARTMLWITHSLIRDSISSLSCMNQSNQSQVR